MELKGKKFVASYSGGKDSMLAVYRALRQGLVPHSLFTMQNVDLGRSWFHSISPSLMQQTADSIGIPLRIVETKGDEYAQNFEAALTAFREQGAEVCVFGDIDLEGHLAWCTERCENVGLVPYFPLWNESRKSLVYEFVDAGFETMLTTVDTARMPKSFLGQVLTRELADGIEHSGADICGENGEYHTFVYNGPIFSDKVDFQVTGEAAKDSYCILTLE